MKKLRVSVSLLGVFACAGLADYTGAFIPGFIGVIICFLLFVFFLSDFAGDTSSWAMPTETTVHHEHYHFEVDRVTEAFEARVQDPDGTIRSIRGARKWES